MIHKLIIAIWNKEELPEEWKESVIVPIRKKGDKTECNCYGREGWTGVWPSTTYINVQHKYIFCK